MSTDGILQIGYLSKIEGTSLRAILNTGCECFRILENELQLVLVHIIFVKIFSQRD